MKPATAELLLASLVLIGTAGAQSPSPGARPTTQVQSDGTAARLKTLERRLARLELRVVRLESAERSVELNPTELSGYQRLQTNNGSFLLSLKNVEPYLDGVRVTVKIGNPSAADYSGFTLNAQWGPRAPEDGEGWLKWYEGLGKKELSFTESLDSGAWNEVSFVLSPAPPAQFGYLELSMVTDIVALRAPQRR